MPSTLFSMEKYNLTSVQNPPLHINTWQGLTGVGGAWVSLVYALMLGHRSSRNDPRILSTQSVETQTER